MKSALYRLLIVSLISLVLFGAATFILSMLRVPALDLLGTLYWDWVLSHTFERLMQLFPAAVVFSVLVTVGLFVDHLHAVRSTGRLDLLRVVVGAALAAGLIHAIFVLSVIPIAGEARRDALATTAAVEHYRQRFDAQLNAERFGMARKHAETIGRIVPALDSEVEERLSRLREAEERAAEDTELQQPRDQAPRDLPRRQTAADSLNRAVEAFNDGDWFTAHLYARRAFDVNPRLSEARTLAEDAWQEIARTARDSEQTRLFERKRAGLRALSEDRSVDAYYLFRELSEEYPDDRDVARYLSEAQQAVSEIAFFVEDIDDLAGLPGQSDIIYVQESEEYRYELIHFDRLVGSPAVRLAIGIEAMGMDESGEPAYRFRAPVGRFIEGTLSVKGLDPDDPGSGTGAEYLQGARPEGLESLIPLETSTTQLLRVSRAQSSPVTLNAFDLFQIYDDATISTFVRESAEQELMSRLLAPFTVFYAVVFAACAAYRGRSRYAERPPLLSLLLLPVLALAAVAEILVLFYLQDVMAGLALIASSFVGALTVLLALQAVFLFISLAVAVRTFK